MAIKHMSLGASHIRRRIILESHGAFTLDYFDDEIRTDILAIATQLKNRRTISLPNESTVVRIPDPQNPDTNSLVTVNLPNHPPFDFRCWTSDRFLENRTIPIKWLVSIQRSRIHAECEPIGCYTADQTRYEEWCEAISPKKKSVVTLGHLPDHVIPYLDQRTYEKIFKKLVVYRRGEYTSFLGYRRNVIAWRKKIFI